MTEINIEELSYEELIELNRQIVERLKMLENIRAFEEMMEFRIGQRVSFQSSKRGEVVGTLAKYNRKTVTVVTEAGESWNVAPSLLSAAEERGGQSSGGGRLIDMSEGEGA